MLTFLTLHIIIFLLTFLVWIYTDQDSPFGEFITMALVTLMMTFFLWFPAFLIKIIITSIIG